LTPKPLSFRSGSSTVLVVASTKSLFFLGCSSFLSFSSLAPSSTMDSSTMDSSAAAPSTAASFVVGSHVVGWNVIVGTKVVGLNVGLPDGDAVGDSESVGSQVVG